MKSPAVDFIFLNNKPCAPRLILDLHFSAFIHLWRDVSIFIVPGFRICYFPSFRVLGFWPNFPPLRHSTVLTFRKNLPYWSFCFIIAFGKCPKSATFRPLLSKEIIPLKTIKAKKKTKKMAIIMGNSRWKLAIYMHIPYSKMAANKLYFSLHVN